MDKVEYGGGIWGQKSMPRQARLASPGTLHHVMVRGIEKRRIVDDETDRRNFVRRLGASAGETRTPIYAWALMYSKEATVSGEASSCVCDRCMTPG